MCNEQQARLLNGFRWRRQGDVSTGTLTLSPLLALRGTLLVLLCVLGGSLDAAVSTDAETIVDRLIQQTCVDCHNKDLAEGDLHLNALPWRLEDEENRGRWVQIHDRVAAGEMPPDGEDLSPADRKELLNALANSIRDVERRQIREEGRGPLRRMTRTEFEDNLKDLLALPELDIADRLPADRDARGFTKVSRLLDMSRVQLDGYLDAADVALRQAMASGLEPPKPRKQRFTGTDLFPAAEAMLKGYQAFLCSGHFLYLREPRDETSS